MKTKKGVSLAYKLLEELGRAIVLGAFSKDGFPTEAELCVQYGVSRTIVREVVKMLSSKGLLVSRQRQGTRVMPMELWNLLDPDVLAWLMARPYSKSIFLEFSQMRLAIEPTAAALAAELMDQASISAIRKALDDMETYADEMDEALAADIDFHVAILKASGNPFFWRLKPLITNALNLSIQLTNEIAGHTADIKAHRAILIAIEKGDPLAAKLASEAILHESIKLIRESQK